MGKSQIFNDMNCPAVTLSLEGRRVAQQLPSEMPSNMLEGFNTTPCLALTSNQYKNIFITRIFCYILPLLVFLSSDYRFIRTDKACRTFVEEFPEISGNPRRVVDFCYVILIDIINFSL